MAGKYDILQTTIVAFLGKYPIFNNEFKLKSKNNC